MTVITVGELKKALENVPDDFTVHLIDDMSQEEVLPVIETWVDLTSNEPEERYFLLIHKN